jgi:hypothetical protein
MRAGQYAVQRLARHAKLTRGFAHRKTKRRKHVLPKQFPGVRGHHRRFTTDFDLILHRHPQ